MTTDTQADYEQRMPSTRTGGWLAPREAQARLGIAKGTLRYYRLKKRVRTRRDERSGWFLFSAADIQALAAEREGSEKSSR